MALVATSPPASVLAPNVLACRIAARLIGDYLEAERLEAAFHDAGRNEGDAEAVVDELLALRDWLDAGAPRLSSLKRQRRASERAKRASGAASARGRRARAG